MSEDEEMAQRLMLVKITDGLWVRPAAIDAIVQPRPEPSTRIILASGQTLDLAEPMLMPSRVVDRISQALRAYLESDND